MTLNLKPVSIAVQPSQWAEFTRLTRSEGHTVSAYIRTMIARELREKRQVASVRRVRAGVSR